MKLWQHIEIPEGGTIDDAAICGIADIYGWTHSGLDKEDYQGWIWWLKLPFVQWGPDWRSFEAHRWYRQTLVIHHVWLGNGRRGLNGMGWQGWQWSMQLWPID